MRHVPPMSFPTQNSHRIVLHNVSDEARDFDRVEDILADGLAAARRALAVHDLPGDYAAIVSRATSALRSTSCRSVGCCQSSAATISSGTFRLATSGSAIMRRMARSRLSGR